MTTIKMNDARSEYDVLEDYSCVGQSIRSAENENRKFIQVTGDSEGQMLVNIDNILSVKWGKKYEK
ncbi:MAG: hypothetical protein [Bacteriophage sp.]|nr:MAG: hypothetical protein [Bacteriophage sp.]